MRNILTIFKKEMRCLTMNPFFFIIAGLFSCIWSYSFFRSLGSFLIQSMASSSPYMQASPGQLNIHYAVFSNHISLTHILLLFALPAFTMKLFTEEKKQGTFDLLITYPIASYDIVIGKFLAALGSLLLLVFISFLYPLMTFGVIENFPWGMLMSSYIGLLLICSVYIALGLLASALSRSIILSVVLGVMLNLFILLILGQSYALTDIPVVRAVLEYMSFAQHFVVFIKGQIKLSSLVWFMSFIAFIIFLTDRVIEFSRWR